MQTVTIPFSGCGDFVLACLMGHQTDSKNTWLPHPLLVPTFTGFKTYWMYIGYITDLTKFSAATPNFHYAFCWQGLEYTDHILCTTKKRGVLDMTLNCSWWWGSHFEDPRSVNLLLHCHYSQVHSYSEWYYLLGFHLWAKLFVLDRETWSNITVNCSY